MEDCQKSAQELVAQPVENIVEADYGGMFTTSLIVAQAFEKEHKDVLKAISNLECSEEFSRRNFAHTPYVHPQNGQTYPAFRLTRDGFAFLAMGFTGKRAAVWKEKFLEAFNAMERRLTAGPLPVAAAHGAGRRAAAAHHQNPARPDCLLGLCGQAALRRGGTGPGHPCGA